MGSICIDCKYSWCLDCGGRVDKYTPQWECVNENFSLTYDKRVKGNNDGDYFVDAKKRVRPVLGKNCIFYNNGTRKKGIKLKKLNMIELSLVFG